MWGLWTWGLGGAVVLVALGGVLTLWSRLRAGRLLRGAPVEGVVVDADQGHTVLMPEGMREIRTRVKVSYPVNGSALEQWMVLDDEQYEAGDRLELYHDRRAPSRVRTAASPNHDFWNALGMLTLCLGGGLLFVLLALAGLRLLVSPAY